MSRFHRALLLATCVLLGVPATAQDQYAIETLVLEGDAVAGVGSVTRVDNLAVNDSGTWLAELDTDHADTDADGVVLKDGVLYLRENQALPSPAGAQLDSFDAMWLDAAGGAVHNFFLDGTSGGSDDSGLYTGTDLLIQEGDPTTAASFSAGTVYVGFFEIKPGAPGRALTMASLDDPALPGSVDRGLVELTHDGAGTLLGEVALVREGQGLPGQSELVTDMETGPHSFDYDADGRAMFVADLAGDTATNMVVGVWDGLNHSIVAQKGLPASVSPTRTWSSLSLAKVDLGDTDPLAGGPGWVHTGSLSGDTSTNSIIVKHARGGVRKLVQEGDVLSGTGGFPLTSFGSGPVSLGDNGHVLFYGDWADPDTSRDTGLFLDGQLIVQEGVTTVGTATISLLRGIQDGYALSANGRWVVFEAQLDNGLEGVFRIDTGTAWRNLDGWLSAQPAGAVEPGAAVTALGIGTLEPGSPLLLTLGNGPASTNATIVASVVLLDAPFKGGTLVPFPSLVLAVTPTDADGALQLPAVWPAGFAPGTTFFLQWWLPDADGPSGFVASNGLAATTP